jgi:hypothetical protein
MSNRVGAFIARRCDGLLAIDMLDRIALFARWQHHVIAERYFSPEGGRESARLYDVLGAHIVAREPDQADAAARALLGHLQQRFVVPLDEYLAAQTRSATKRGRRKD